MKAHEGYTNKKGITGNGHKGHLATAGIDITNDASTLAQRFITAAESVYEAISNTVFVDDKQLSDTVALFSWLIRNEVIQGLEDLLVWLNGRPSIGGYGRAQAVMVGTGLIAAEALGVPLSKDSQKFIREQIAARARDMGVQEEPPKPA